MQKKIWWWLSLLVTISLAGSMPDQVGAQGTWPPVSVQVKPVVTGNTLTFEIKATNVADWTLADFNLKASIPAGTSFAEGHADFDGAVASFDGQDVSFFVITLPSGATLGFRYTVNLADGTTQCNLPQIWIGWKGRLPGQYLFDFEKQTVNTSTMPSPKADSTLAEAIARGLKVIQVHGSAYEQGMERGQALAKDIKDQVTAQLSTVLPLAYDGSRTKWLDAVHRLITQVDSDVIDELKGMAEGSGVALDDLEILNFSSYVFPDDTSKNSPTACSVLAVNRPASQSNGLIIGRHQDMDLLAARLVFIVRHFSDRRPPRLDLAQPASADMWVSVTGSGLFWEGHPVSSNEPAPAGAADLLSLVGGALRKARTLDELQNQLLAQPRLKAMNMTIASLPQNQVRIVEASTTRSAVTRSGADGLLVSTNHFASSELSSLRPPPENRSQARYERLHEVAGANQADISPQMMRTFMYDPHVFEGTGFTIVVDAATMHIGYWDEVLGGWLDLAISDLLGN